MKITTKKKPTFREILNVRVDITSAVGVLRQVQQFVTKKKKFLVVTPNPEQIVYAQKDSLFRKILNSADIAIPDAVGLSAASKFMDLPLPKNRLLRIPTLLFQGLFVGLSVIFNKEWPESELKIVKGRDLFMEIVKVANKKRWKVVLVGDIKESAQKAVKVLARNYKGVKLFALSGPNLNSDGLPIDEENKETERYVIREVNRIKPQMVFVGFGAPKQEKWAYRWLPKLETFGTMVVGGTFDYVSGTTKLPPKFIENLGFEWLWRLLTGSQKPDRIFRATIEFPLRVFWSKLTSV